MQVLYHDIETKLRWATRAAAADLGDLLRAAVVPARAGNPGDAVDGRRRELAPKMKPGAHLINASRGSVVEIEPLAAAREGRLGGAAVDVFPAEPKGNDEAFESPLRGLDNVIPYPHVGGSTRWRRRTTSGSRSRPSWCATATTAARCRR